MLNKNQTSIIRKILQVIKKYNRFLITGHARPDGDCLGSQLTFSRLLNKMGKKTFLINAGKIPDEMLFLSGARNIKTFHPNNNLPDNIEVIIILDSGGLDRLEEMEQCIKDKINTRNRLKQPTPIIINIDHHPTHGSFGDINWVDYKMSSLGEMLYLLIKQSGIDIDKPMAEYLYVSIDTDTGHFCFSSTTAQSHIIAAELIQKGLNVAEIYQRIYGNKKYNALMLFVECLKKVKLALNGQVAWSVLTRQMYKKYRTEPSDSQNYISHIKAIEGVKVALLFRETTENPLEIKVSVRAAYPIDANKLVKPLGGGGHHRASGLTLNPPLKKARQQLINHIAKELKL
jgi:phosphoesterase RecJ-like protein